MSVATVTDKQWEALADMARGLLDEQDRQRWALGEIVDTVQTHYKDSSIIKFCEQVKANPKTLYQYRQVYRFYPKDVWQEYPMVRYTQWRDAMQLKDANVAIELLARFNDKNMRMVDFYDELKRLMGEISTAETTDKESVIVPIDYDENTGVITVRFLSKKPRLDKGLYKVTVEKA